MRKEKNFKWKAGMSSIILILVIFAMVVFAVLAVRVSNSDLMLAKRTKETLQVYYKADSEAEMLLKQIDQVLQNYYDDLSGIALKVQLQNLVKDKGSVVAKNDKVGVITYQIKINKDAKLSVEINYDIERGNETYYDIVKWRLDQTEVGACEFHNFG